MNKRREIEEFCIEFEIPAMFLDNYDDEIIDLIISFDNYKILYDTQKIIDKLSQDMTIEEAEEFFSFNIIGAYIGENTPAFTVRLK
jgi:hypothetical protein